MSECILFNKELENATRLIKIAIENFPAPISYTKEDEERLINSLLKSLDELKQNSNQSYELLKEQSYKQIQEWLKDNDSPIHPSSWNE